MGQEEVIGMSRLLVIDGQIFQTPAWHRGVGNASHLQSDDDIIELVWSIYDFIVSSEEVSSIETVLPKRNAFTQHKKALRFYDVVASGVRGPIEVAKLLGISQVSHSKA